MNIMPLLLAAGGIVLVDIVLSGDNALVIGAAASRLPRGQRFLAIFWGGVGAIVFRVILAVGATELLLIPLAQAIGGLVLLVITVRLLLPESGDNAFAKRSSDRLWPAIVTILLADLTMSLDNVLAVGALAHGNIELLVLGLLFSMLLLFVASALIARLIERFWWLLDLAAAVLAYTAANLIIEDPIVGPLLHLRTTHGATVYALALQVGLVVAALLTDGILRFSRRRSSHQHAGASAAVAQSAQEATSPVQGALGSDVENARVMTSVDGDDEGARPAESGEDIEQVDRTAEMLAAREAAGAAAEESEV